MYFKNENTSKSRKSVKMSIKFIVNNSKLCKNNILISTRKLSFFIVEQVFSLTNQKRPAIYCIGKTRASQPQIPLFKNNLKFDQFLELAVINLYQLQFRGQFLTVTV